MDETNRTNPTAMGEEAKRKESPLALFISILLHPLFMALYGVALLFIYTDFQYIFASQFFKFMSPVLILSCLVPVSSLILFKRAGMITSYALEKKEERFLPFLTTFFSYCVLFFYFYKAGLYTWFLSTLLVPIILLVVCSFINRYWKISAHMTGIGGLLGTVLSVCYNIKGQNPYVLFIILIILVGALAVSRLVLNRHTPAQVYVGFLVGLIISYITVFIGGYYPILLLMIR